ncbi:MAG: DUF2461 domain-containing protein [Cytophagales bacterium]
MNFVNAFSFLGTLRENNHKLWFDENRTWYEEVKADWQKTVGELIKAIGEFDSEIGILEPKNCIFRINRDVRFAKDKSPYKTNLGAYFAKGGKKSKYAGYYVQIDPTSAFLATGIWMPEPAQLQAVRQEIDYHFGDFKAAVESKEFVADWGKLEGEKLSSIPKGFEKDNIASEYLKHKSFIATKNITSSELEKMDFVKFAARNFRASKPLHDFLNKAVDV